MLESIGIKNVATYGSQGVRIEHLKKINFIYGANGCGKTTISKLLYNPKEPDYSSCNLEWKGKQPVNTLVYNKDFRDRNFGKGKLDGVFTLGEATKEEMEAIEKMRVDLESLSTEGIKKAETLEKMITANEHEQEEFRDILWRDVYKKNEDDFKEAFRGFLKKETFKEKLLSEYTNNKTVLLTHDELKEKAETIFGQEPALLSTVNTFEFTKLVDIESNEVWGRKIVGKADVQIASLIQRLNLNDWVNEGLSYLQNDNTCPFCQQSTITKAFRKEIEDFFDEKYTNDIKLIKVLGDSYVQQSQNLQHFLEQIELREKDNISSKMNMLSFSALLKTLTSQLVANRELISNKIKEPSRSITMLSTKEQLEAILKLILICNAEIVAHNKLVNDYDNERSKLISSVWRYLIESHRALLDTFVKKTDASIKAISGLQKLRQDLRERYKMLSGQIKQANKNVTSVQPSVDEINGILKSYGFLNFEIVPAKEPNKYQIQREDGSIAEQSLSEGEASFITFLYYLQHAKGSTHADSITEERILVIDDPISSMDSNVLFVVSTLIKQIIKAIKENKGCIKQLILLTHNVYFHKEVSFVDGRTKENGNTHYWILRKNNNITTIQSFQQENPIHSSYELLWKELANSQKNSSITVQNTMRRIIENYFKILGRYADDDLIKSFENHHEQEICRSLVSWINDGSHGLPDDLYVEQQESLISRYLTVFKEIFSKMGHAEHYNMMFKEPAVAHPI